MRWVRNCAVFLPVEWQEPPVGVFLAKMKLGLRQSAEG